MYRGRDIGINAARGEWIGFPDGDDLWLPSKLAMQLDAAAATAAGVTGCDYVAVDWTGEIPGKGNLRRRPELTWAEALSLECLLPPSGLLVRTNAIKSIGAFDERLGTSEDRDMIRRLAQRYQVHNEVVSMRYRCHASNVSNHR